MKGNLPASLLARLLTLAKQRQRQWQAFLTKNRITAAGLAETVTLLDDLLWPPTQVAAAQSQATATWRPDLLRWV